MADWMIQKFILDGWFIVVIAVAFLLETFFPLGKILRSLWVKATSSLRGEDHEHKIR